MGAQRGENEEDVDMPDARPQSTSRAPAPEPEEEPEDEETVAAKKAKVDADKEKAEGTACYKKREFDQAISHYTKAWEIHKDITYLTNRSAANFEKGDYQACIEDCKQAVEHGREVLADFKIIAKAFGRMGSAYEKLEDLANAVEYYQRSLTEHRTPEILNKLRAAEKAKKTAETNAYMDPAKAEEARELGSQKFKESDWPAAVEGILGDDQARTRGRPWLQQPRRLPDQAPNLPIGRQRLRRGHPPRSQIHSRLPAQSPGAVRDEGIQQVPGRVHGCLGARHGRQERARD